MKVTLQRYIMPIPIASLPEVLRSPSAQPTENLGLEVDFTRCFELIGEFRDEAPTTSKQARSTWDARLAGPLHSALEPRLTRRLANDPRLWHWLCTATQFREYVWLRWHGLVPADYESALADGDLPRRFLGSATLVGMSRNAVARPYWTVETLSDGAPYDQALVLAREVLTRTDLHLNLFERLVGLHPPAARAAIRTLADLKEAERRQALVRLNHVATTTMLERLDEQGVTDLLTA